MTSRWNDNGRHGVGFPTHVKKQAGRALPHQCAHCGDDAEPLQLDHIVNQARGGTHALSNAQWLCVPCHNTKTKAEQAAGRARRRAWATRERPAEKHPGTR